MAYFSTDPGGLGEFGCGADCSCKSCRSASNVGEVYEKEEIPSPAPATPPTTPKMGGWFDQPPVPRARVSAMPAQLRMPPFEVGFALSEAVSVFAGLKSTTWINRKNAPLVQSALAQSRVLKPFISSKQQPPITLQNFVFHGSDAEFNHAYLKSSKTVVPFGSEQEKRLVNIRGFYDRPTDRIHVRPSTTLGLAVRLAIHRLSSPALRNFFGKALDDGLSLYFANQVLSEQGVASMSADHYSEQLRCAMNLIQLVGVTEAAKAYFVNPSDLIRHLSTNLNTGPISHTDLTKGALCTPRFDKASFQRRCKGFLKEYELTFNPDEGLRFGVVNNPNLSRQEKDERRREVSLFVPPMQARLIRRAEAALQNAIPTFPALPTPLKNIALKFSTLQFNLFRKWFPAGNGVNFFSVQDCFEQFANGELRDPSVKDHPGLYEPDSAAYFLFAEFAFLCLELGRLSSFWEKALRPFVKTQEIFMHIYRESPKSPPPAVNAPVSLRSTPRNLSIFLFSNFKQIGPLPSGGEGQSDLKRKLALREKYDRMGVNELKVAARDNLRRAQLMV
jgi:hypothetical protein